jgi:serine/threonine-protein phosphatase 2A regulatory subunit B''
MLVDAVALQSFEYGSLSIRMINRVMEGCGLGKRVEKPNSMTYKEFIPFIIASEDKTTSSAIEYWFRCLDLDGDGLISLHELNYFWEEQYERMVENRSNDPWKFNDFVCSL